MGKNPFCYHAKLGGGKEFANCSHLVATRTEAGACFSIHFLGNCEKGNAGQMSCCNLPAWSFHFHVAFLIVANIAYNEANEGKLLYNFLAHGDK